VEKIKIFNPLVLLVVVSIRFYQLFFSPFFVGSCRFQPNCSQYSMDSFKKFGFFKGLFLTIKRLLKCHPLGKSGYDPIEDKIRIKEVSLDVIRPFRLRNLYNRLPEKLGIYPEDFVKTTKHFVLYIDENVTSCLTLIKKKNKPSDPESYQIRGMVTIKEFRGRGYASMLINHLSKNLKKKKTKIIWCNSRVSAINFYKKNRFEETGLSFKKKLIGAHQRVARYL